MRTQYVQSSSLNLSPSPIQYISWVELAPLSNPCLSQPCLNGGQCLAKDVTTFQCQCAAGFDGSHCELDAQICQTQQPCGQAMGTKCQSFRPNAALQFACIHQNGLAYGLSAQQSNASLQPLFKRQTCVVRCCSSTKSLQRRRWNTTIGHERERLHHVRYWSYVR